MVYGVFFEIGLINNHVAWSIEHFACGAESHLLHGINNPLVDFVREFVEVDVILLLSVFCFAIHIDGVSGEH